MAATRRALRWVVTGLVMAALAAALGAVRQRRIAEHERALGIASSAPDRGRRP